MKHILITGAKGFIGSHVCKYFKQKGYTTYGIGHGALSIEESQAIGLDYWKTADISINSILGFKQSFDVIIHCGGGGTVGFSVENPYQDFKKTVDGTLEVLEYMRLYNPRSHLIYPSSPAVQGECENKPIKEDYIGKPVSPYGYHKKSAENLCQSYSEKYGLKVSVVRLFSVYGNGLKKQLLWDAYNKISNAEDNAEIEFWGTGEETRDFIHISDVLSLIEILLLDQRSDFSIINGGSGNRYTIRDVLGIIKTLVNDTVHIDFNNKINIGNPIYYWADTENLSALDFKSKVDFYDGIKVFIKWAANEKN